jgi:L-2,4-diaminobutyric acid acetyltransferase
LSDLRSELAPTRATSPCELRALEAGDAAAIWRCARASKILDVNSPYAYLLLCSDFADAGIVAARENEVLGFVVGYRPPPRPETLFVWQVAVAAAHRGEGLAGRMLDAILARHLAASGRYVEATVTPSNRASAALFTSFAQRHEAPLVETPAFARELFPDGDHEDETRLRMGPFA